MALVKRQRGRDADCVPIDLATERIEGTADLLAAVDVVASLARASREATSCQGRTAVEQRIEAVDLGDQGTDRIPLFRTAVTVDDADRFATEAVVARRCRVVEVEAASRSQISTPVALEVGKRDAVGVPRDLTTGLVDVADLVATPRVVAAGGQVFDPATPGPEDSADVVCRADLPRKDGAGDVPLGGTAIGVELADIVATVEVIASGLE